MIVAVAGATGVVGRPTVARLVADGHRVRALARSGAADRLLRALGAEPVRGDLLTGAGVSELVRGADATVHLATAIPKDGADWSANDRVRREGTARLLEAAAAAGVARHIQQSVAFLQPSDPRDAWTDESVTAVTAHLLQSAADMEAAVRAAPLDWRIVRGGLLYGPGTGLVAGWRAAARESALRLPGDGGDYASLVHVDDLAAALVAAVEAPDGRLVATVCDDAPLPWSELLALVAALDGSAPPAPGGPVLLPSVRARNAAAEARLGWRPFYPSIRLALAASARAGRHTDQTIGDQP